MIVRALIGLLVALSIGCGGDVVTDDAGMSPDASAVFDAATVAPTDAAAAPDAAPGDAGPLRTEPTLPVATGACPDLSESGIVTVSPSGLPARQAHIWVDASATDDGPVVFFWHGVGGSPTEASYALGATLDEITGAGGIVIAPVHDPAAGTFPWYLTTGGSREDDLVVADELLACAEEDLGIDERRVHTIGFSAGALHSTQMAFRRASYVASVVLYSGGLITARAPRTDAPDARFAAMVLFGGERDEVVINFATASRNLEMVLETRGDFSFLCDHGMGHTVPSAAIASAWRFLQDHPYASRPDPYASGLPDGFYAPCAL